MRKFYETNTNFVNVDHVNEYPVINPEFDHHPSGIQCRPLDTYFRSPLQDNFSRKNVSFNINCSGSPGHTALICSDSRSNEKVADKPNIDTLIYIGNLQNTILELQHKSKIDTGLSQNTIFELHQKYKVDTTQFQQSINELQQKLQIFQEPPVHLTSIMSDDKNNQIGISEISHIFNTENIYFESIFRMPQPVTKFSHNLTTSQCQLYTNISIIISKVKVKAWFTTALAYYLVLFGLFVLYFRHFTKILPARHKRLIHFPSFLSPLCILILRLSKRHAWILLHFHKILNTIVFLLVRCGVHI